MKKILNILRNQAVDSADQNLIDTLRKEVETEKFKDSEKKGFDHNLISHFTSSQKRNYKKQNTIPRSKLIFAFGCTSIIILFVLLNPFPKLKLIIPGEREKLERQMQVLNEIKETKKEIEASLHSLTETLTHNSAPNFNKEWVDSFPGYQALLSLADIRDEFLQIPPIDVFHVPQNINFEFLYKREWELIKEKVIGRDSRESSI